MTFDDDFIRLPMMIGDVNIPAVRLGVEWPPPNELIINGLIYHQTRCSQITDEQREGMTHVARGAEYEYVGLDPNYERETCIPTDESA